jgi:diadenosine tetraphosphate (Ap4A) HIT family hydrolase
MKTIQTSQQAGPDGKLRLEIPVDKVGHTYHVLVIPRAHVERLIEVPIETLGAVMSCAQRISRAIQAVAKPDGFAYLTEDDLTGQGYNLVAHWKLHVIARFQGDAVRLDWGRTPDAGVGPRAATAAQLRDWLKGAS